MIITPASTMPHRKSRAYSYIRFSRPEQMRGDSLRRQTELSERYARENDLELDNTLDLRDTGVSAFRGKNATEGALAGFLDAVADGRVKKGSYLLVESLDRLSRQEVLTALQRFLLILEKGIKIVTLQDQQVYSTESLNGNFAGLLVSLTIMARAHEESATKSKRLSAAWANKRANIGGKKLTSLCPGWLELSADRKTYRPIPARVAIVKRIFTEAAEGKGRRLVASRLNAEGVAPWGIGGKKGVGWHDSYVSKILESRAVLGEYQPHRLINGKRVAEGEVIKDYFPAVIPEDLFYRANAAKKARRLKGGRVGVAVQNLFSGLCVCGECGGSVVYSNKGKENWRYLQCFQTSRKITKCVSPSTPYPWVERAFIKWIIKHDFTGGQKTLKQQKEAELETVRGRLIEVQKRAANLAEAIASTGKIASLVPLLQAAETEIEFHKGAEAQLMAEIERTSDAVNTTDFQELAKKPEHRFRLREEVRKLVEKITFHFNPPDERSGDSFFAVRLKDGSVFDIYSDDTVGLWTPDGTYYHEEPQPRKELEPAEPIEWPKRRTLAYRAP